MKWLISIITCLVGVSGPSWGQNDSLPPGVLDGVYVSEHLLTCDMDTMIQFRENVQFVVKDSSGAKYNFEAGSKSYYEVTINTVTCRCKDCRFSKTIVVEVQEGDSVITLGPENSHYMFGNSWKIKRFQEGFSGTLDLKQHRMRIYEAYEGHPEIILWETKFKHPDLSLR